MPRTNYLWDEVNDTLLAETDEAGNTIVEYAHEPGLYGPLISQRRNGHTYYHHYDGLGSTRALTDETGNVTDSYTYTAFGEPVTSTGSTTNPFGYKGALGYYVNSETMDLYVRRRTYSPVIARWMSQDPIGVVTKDANHGRGSTFSAPNLYRYVANAPIVRIDPSGLRDCYCKGCCPVGMPAFNATLNNYINTEIAKAAKVAGNLPALEVAVWISLAQDVKQGGLPATAVENWIGNWVGAKVAPALVVPGPKVVKVVKTADCFRLTCRGASYCIGSDKIGHMFQQGHMLYEIETTPGLDSNYAFAFAMLTEGIMWKNIQLEMVKHPEMGLANFTEIHNWLENASFTFEKFFTSSPLTKISTFRGKWGNTVGTGIPLVAQLSMPDVWADVGGAKFWAELMAGKIDGTKTLFDICNYLDAKWEE